MPSRLLGLVSAGFALRGAYNIALACWVANRLLDGLDGVQSRVHHRQSDFGGYLDIVLDHVVYAAIPLGLLLSAPTVGLGIATAFMLSSFYTNAASWMYLAAILERRGMGASARGELTTITMPRAIIAGTETMVLFTMFFLLPGYLTELFVVMGALVCVNVVQRLVWAYRALAVPRS